MSAMRVEEPALLCVMVFLLLSSMLSALFLGLLSFEQPMDLGNVDHDAKHQKRFIHDAITGKAKLFYRFVGQAFSNKLANLLHEIDKHILLFQKRILIK